jgi:hypothetical protein
MPPTISISGESLDDLQETLDRLRGSEPKASKSEPAPRGRGRPRNDEREDSRDADKGDDRDEDEEKPRGRGRDDDREEKPRKSEKGGKGKAKGLDDLKDAVRDAMDALGDDEGEDCAKRVMKAYGAKTVDDVEPKEIPDVIDDIAAAVEKAKDKGGREEPRKRR